MLKRSEITVLV